MSRSGYTDECDDNWAMIRWMGALASSMRGKRGQAFLREIATALDTLPEKVLIAEELEKDGDVCALGAVGKVRGLDMNKVDPEDYDQVAAAFGINEKLAREVMWQNDEGGWKETPQERWQRVRNWVQKQITVVPEDADA